MASIEDLILQKFLINNKFATSQQIQECLEEQKVNPDKSLGDLLLEKGYISQNQLILINNLHKKGREERKRPVQQQEKESLFGKIVLMKKFAQEGEIEECLKIQKELQKKGQYLKLGEILVQKAYLSKYQVEEVLKIQQNKKEVPLCERCGQPFLREEAGENIRFQCKACKIILTLPKSS